jgi:putative transcriptional regulator
MPKVKSDILAAVHETAKELRRAGVLSQTTMREFDALCLEPVKPLSPRQIIRLRYKVGTSQAVFAAYLNVSASTVQKWETGQKVPSGPALKLLNLVAKRGLEAIG